MSSLALAAADDLPLVERVRMRAKATKLPSPEVCRAIRLAARVTIEEVAGELRVSALTVSRWERGLAEPRTQHAIDYRELLDALREVSR